MVEIVEPPFFRVLYILNIQFSEYENDLKTRPTLDEVKEQLAKTRDLFCFCAFASLRYSDMEALKRTDIDGDKIYITTQKANDRLPIDLSKNGKEILPHRNLRSQKIFICFALSNGVPPPVVMKWTGHSAYKAMRPYIDISEKTKADAMKLIDNAWGM